MSKLYRETVEAQEDGSGHPTAFRWQGRWYQVESFSLVRLSLRNPWEPERWRVTTRGGGVFELTKDRDQWVLWRMWD